MCELAFAMAAGGSGEVNTQSSGLILFLLLLLVFYIISIVVRSSKSQSKNNNIEVNSFTQEYQYIKDPTSLTEFLKTFLWILMSISVLSILFDLMQMDLLSSGSFSRSDVEANETRQQVVAILYLLAFFVTGIAFLKWIHLANKNCHGFGAQGMKFTPGWSIGYYFIPILSLYKPYQAMKEIWKVSTNPINWQNENGSALLGYWWMFYLTTGILGIALFRMSSGADTIAELKYITTISIISQLFDILLCIVAVSLINAIYTKQEKLIKENITS